MGLLKKIFGRPETSVPQKKLEADQLLRSYDTLKEKVDALNKENEEWQAEFNGTIDFRQKARELEKENKLQEAIVTYLQSIEQGEKSKRLKINNYAFDIERVIILYSKTKQKDVLERFLEEKISLYPDYRDTKKWAVRLSKLKNKKIDKTTPITPNEIVLQKPSNPTIGYKIDDFKNKMPEFNFYYNMPIGTDTMGYNHNVSFEYFKKLREYREAFETIKSLAKISENKGDYKKAIEAYEKMIIEEYKGPEPYERLIIIYSKLKWIKEEKKKIEKGITFFTNLKTKQLNHVLSLAEKYDMKDKAMEYINADKKIFYYGGAFELYNPQKSRIVKWEKRLEKVNQKLQK